MHKLMTRPHTSQCVWSAQPQGELTLANFAGSFNAVAAIPCSPVMSQLSAIPDTTVTNDRATFQTRR